MFVTFGILTKDRGDEVNSIIDSIEANKIPHDNYEIVIVGNVDVKRLNARVFRDDESEDRSWITRKKNIVIDNSSAGDDDLVVVAKDYIKYDKDWYNGLLKFASEWEFDICMNEIANEGEAVS